MSHIGTAFILCFVVPDKEQGPRDEHFGMNMGMDMDGRD